MFIGVQAALDFNTVAAISRGRRPPRRIPPTAPRPGYVASRDWASLNAAVWRSSSCIGHGRAADRCAWRSSAAAETAPGWSASVHKCSYTARSPSAYKSTISPSASLNRPAPPVMVRLFPNRESSQTPSWAAPERRRSSAARAPSRFCNILREGSRGIRPRLPSLSVVLSVREGATCRKAREA